MTPAPTPQANARPTSTRSRGPLQRLLAELRSQRFGVWVGLSSAALLGIGSFIMDLSPDAYRGLALDDLRFFFAPMRLTHWWLYLLALSLGLWGLSAALCTWDSLLSRLRHHIWRPSAYGAPVLHIAFILMLVTHLWGGLTESSERHVIGPGPTPIGDATYRPLSVDVDRYPTGMPRHIEIALERTRGDERERVIIGYNTPIVSRGGASMLLLGDYGTQTAAALEHHGARFTLSEGERHGQGASEVIVHKIYVGASLRSPMADVTLGGEHKWLILGAEAAPDALAFVALERRPMLSVTERLNPSAPLVSLVALLAALGVALIAAEHLWRWRRRRRVSSATGLNPSP